MHETSAWGWMIQRDGIGREVGGGCRMGNTCKSMADSCQCMAKTTKIFKVISLQLMKIIGGNKAHKEQILKAARGKQQITHKEIPIRITADLSIETLQARR